MKSEIVPLYGGKEPYTPVLENFHGYLGVLLYNKVTDEVQCHICGAWYIMLNTHIKRTHKLPPNEYKAMFGFFPKNKLMGERARARKIEIFLERIKKNPEILEKMKEHWNRRNFDKIREKGQAVRAWDRMVMRNKNNICPAQIVKRVKTMAESLNRTPKAHEFGHFHAVKRIFGNYRGLLKEAHLTPLPNGKQKWSRMSLLKTLLDFKERYGRIPTYSDTTRGLLPNGSNFRQFFGSFGRAKESIGMPVFANKGFNKYRTSYEIPIVDK